MKMALIVFGATAIVLSIATGRALPSIVVAGLAAIAFYSARTSRATSRLNKRYAAAQRMFKATGRQVMLEPVCAVCLRRLPDDGSTHVCEAILSTVQTAEDPSTGNAFLQGALVDGLNVSRWGCPHEHGQEAEALECAREHARMHFARECHCSYYAMPLPPVFVQARNAYVYVMRSKKLNAVKIGTSARAFPARVSEHVDNGWELVGAVLGLTGFEAYLVEQEVLADWRVAGYRLGVRADEMPQKGHTETASLLVVDPERVLTHVCARTGREAHRSVAVPERSVQVIRVTDGSASGADERGMS